MQVIQQLIRADGVHIGVQTFARLQTKICQLQPLPLRQRLDNFSAAVLHGLNWKYHRSLDTVKIIVDAGTREHEQRGSHAHQIQLERQVTLEELLDLSDRQLRLA